MQNDVWAYSRLLAEQLRLNGVKEPQVREVVAQVQQHVRESGEDPVVAFGQPSDYAKEWKRLSPSAWGVRLVGACAGVTGLQAGLQALFADGGWRAEVPIDGGGVFTWVVWVVGLALVPWTLNLWLSRRIASGVGHRFWGHPTLARLAVPLCLIALVVVMAMVFGQPTDRVLFTVPRWGLLVLFVVGIPGFAFFAGPSRQMPEAPGVDESWSQRIRRAFFTP